MDPMHECRGLCLASAAPRKGDPSALASSTDTSGQHDKLPVLPQACRSSSVVRPRTFYLSVGSRSEPPLFSWERTRRRTVSLLANQKCLNLQAYGSTDGQNSQIEKGEAKMECFRTRQFLPAHACGASLPQAGEFKYPDHRR